MDLLIPILMGDPIWQSPRRDYVGALSGSITGYDHEIRAIGGYWQANIPAIVRSGTLFDLIQNGLGRNIEAYSPHQTRMFEGFINKIEAPQGEYSIVVGPLIGSDGVTNSIKVAYSTIDTSTDPPTLGIRKETDLADDADSQARYGTIRHILSAGGMTDSEAQQVRDLYLLDYRNPKTTQDFSGRGGLEVNLECLGYVHLLDAFPFEDSGTGSQDASAKIQAAVAAHPDSIFSTDYNQIQSNTLQVARGEEGLNTAWAVIKATVAKGDVDNNRWLFGVYDNRVVYYYPVPEKIEYQQRMTLSGAGIERLGGGIVKPWDVKPGRWLIKNDVLTGLSQPAELLADPRVSFIESVKYRAPYDVQPVGGRVNSIQQKLARHGLGGI